jgi:hypothetical protein
MGPNKVFLVRSNERRLLCEATMAQWEELQDNKRLIEGQEFASHPGKLKITE